MTAISDLDGIPTACSKGYAGIDYLLVGSLNDVVITTDDETKMATIALSTNAGAPALLTDVFKKYKATKETSSLVSTMTGTPSTGAISYVPVATLLLSGNKVLAAVELEALSQGCLVVIAVGFNGEHEIAGVVRGMEMTANENTTGTAANDMRGNTVTLTGSEPKDLYFIDQTTLDSLSA